MLNGAGESPPQAPAGFGLTDIEEGLKGPEREAAAGSIEAALQSVQARVEAALAGGLRPDLFAQARDIAAAVAAARRVLAVVKSETA